MLTVDSQFGKTLYHQGDLSYFEAVNKETLKNAYSRFEEEGILYVVKSKDAKTQPARLRISHEWMPKRDAATGDLLPEGRLWQFTEKIASSRREGKNRRDGATVSTRVLRLSDLLGRRLFAEATTAPDGSKKLSKLSEEAAQVKKAVREERRRRRLEGRAQL